MAKPDSPSSAAALGCTHLQLRQLMLRVGQHYDSRVAEAGLKTTQYSLLTAAEKLGPVRPGALARVLGIEPSTLTRNLQPLVAAGLLTVGAGPDGRSRLVTITAAGRARRSQARPLWQGAQRELVRLLGDERALALHALLGESLALLKGRNIPRDAA